MAQSYGAGQQAEGEFRTCMYHLACNVVADEAKKSKHAQHHDDFTDWADKLGDHLRDI
jgi:hypothetical protein